MYNVRRLCTSNGRKKSNRLVQYNSRSIEDQILGEYPENTKYTVGLFLLFKALLTESNEKSSPFLNNILIMILKILPVISTESLLESLEIGRVTILVRWIVIKCVYFIFEISYLGLNFTWSRLEC